MMAGVSRLEVVELARAAALVAGYSWKEPVRVVRWFGVYIVTSNWKSRGGALRVTVDRGSGRVLKVWVSPK
jgi:hypothetical protein